MMELHLNRQLRLWHQNGPRLNVALKYLQDDRLPNSEILLDMDPGCCGYIKENLNINLPPNRKKNLMFCFGAGAFWIVFLRNVFYSITRTYNLSARKIHFLYLSRFNSEFRSPEILFLNDSKS